MTMIRIASLLNMMWRCNMMWRLASSRHLGAIDDVQEDQVDPAAASPGAGRAG